ncbi:hypothetical protein BDDG_09810 [Blastomyces dermatitidis ATCC 18188]|uniref:Uncharacterized protein n=1 Tax=Ajellomyces dermatitidis (strain ATCC 18188 / CBS 674.68) TaxID=653446 RepID=F2TUE7_AJEDA|nr:hypothetical protein BDDG_09810 [Blastomyces dermatitidis ATCC 18188]EQL30326.1 hypothetical protein BDFG_07158 [Blastomyces dermatitidis ATCC 26199]
MLCISTYRTARIPHKFPSLYRVLSYARTMATITRRVTDPSGIASHFITTLEDMKGEVEHLERIKNVLDEFPIEICNDDTTKPQPTASQTIENLQEMVQEAIKYRKRSMDKTEVTLKELCNTSDVDAKVIARTFEYLQCHQADRCEMEHQHLESHRTYRSESEKECHGSSEAENERI